MAVYRALRNTQNHEMSSFDPMNRIVNALLNSDFYDDVDDEMKTIAPRADMKETDDAVIVNMTMPGINADDIDISVNNGILTVQGESKEEKEDKDEKGYLMKEQTARSYYRQFELPTNVVADKAKADYKNGVLNLELPKAEEVKPKTIKVSVSGK